MIVYSNLQIPDARGSAGAILFVSDGISRGKAWTTFYRKENGCLARLKRKALPMRDHRFEAANDLRNFAAKQRWPIDNSGELP